MLPSDIARLVLMYLKDEGLNRSYQQFFKDSPHLEELRCHPDVEPSVPYEKGLAEILNEYAKIINAIKDRLSCNQLVNSLWKMHNEVIGQLKFQYTGNAGLLQTQENRCLSQRALSRHRLTGLRKQQELQRKMAATQPTGILPTSSSNVVASTYQPEISSALNSSYSGINSSYMSVNSSPSVMNSSYSVMNSSHSVQDPTHSVVNSGLEAHNTVSVATSPIENINGSSPTAQTSSLMPRGDVRIMSPEMHIEVEMHDIDTSREQQSSDLNLQHDTVVIPEQRTPAKSSQHAGTLQDTPIGKSPKRKSATPRRLQGTMATTISPRSETTSSANQWEDHEDGRDLPEVLESLIKNIEFQEKLAQNINKAIPLENIDKQAEPIKSADTTNHHAGQSSTSIEDLLNLHMSDDTIHDIVQKTSSDPAFESLFSLFNQNSQDGSSLQLENPSNETPATDNDIMTGQSAMSATLQSNQSHSTTDHEVGQVVQQAANQSSGEVAPVCGPASTSSSTPSSSANVMASTYTGQLNTTSSTPAATSSFIAVTQQDATNQFTSSSTTQMASIQSTDQVLTLPVILNQSGPYQVVQQPMLNSPASLPGGTIFMSPDGRILGTSGVVLPDGQPLQASGVLQSVNIRQAGMQGIDSSRGAIHDATPNNPHNCPVHGTNDGTSGSKQSTGLPTTSAVTSTLNQTNATSSGGARSEVLQLLSSMVQSDVGSLFSGSPEKSHSRTPTSSKRTPPKERSRQRGARSPKTPSTNGPPGSVTLNRNNQNNNETVGNPGLNQRASSTENAVRLHSKQSSNATPNTVSAIPTEGQAMNPGLASGRHTPQVSTTSPEVGVPAVSPAVNTGKQRKHIQFKQVVLSRTLDVGGSLELPSRRTRQSPATATKGPRATRANRQGSNAQMMDQSRPSNPAGQKTVATPANQCEMAPVSKPANQHAQLMKSTPEKILHMPSDMSPEVNIAAQMLVCLSNSPPSLRQSPHRVQRLRRNSGCSPARSPTRDHIVELRKEIGLTPKNSNHQQKNVSETLAASTRTSQEQPHPKECSTGINEVNQSGSKSKKDAGNSKRKSRTPRKQKHTVTETVVLTVPSESSHKSKTSTSASDNTSAPSTIQTRAATLKSQSPVKPTNDPIPTRKSTRNSKSPSRPTSGINGLAKGDSGKGMSEHSDKDSEKTESRGQKRSREEQTKEQSVKKQKTAKNSKKTKKSKGFPSNLDVDKFLSSLQYSE